MGTSLFCNKCGAALLKVGARCPACGALVPDNGSSAPSTRPLASPPSTTATAGGSSPNPPCLLAPGFLLAQRYKILKQLGQGGFATVYKARDRAQRNRIVAIKQIHLETLDLHAMLDATDAYNREVNALSLMRSRYLPRIYNYFMDEQHWYIVLEYIAGKTLEEKLASKRRGFLPVVQVLDIGIALCEALQHLHMQQPPLIFRDVKPANVIITRSGRLYLIDFGTTRHYRPGWKDTGPLGTPGYAAPEQYGKRAHTTPQSDIYSLGATLQTALIGKDPLEIRQQGIPPQRAKNIPQALLSELEHMQMREATRRPRNMAEVKQALQEIKAQALSQKIKARGAFLWELFHETSAFIYISLMLIVLVDFAAFAEKTWPPLWLISCLISGIFTCLSSIFALREARQQNQAKLPLNEKISLIWKRLATSLPITLVITLLIYYLFAMLDPFGMGGYDDYIETNVITFGIIVGGGLVACLCWAGIHLVHLQAARKYARQKQQEMLLQQTIRHHQ